MAVTFWVGFAAAGGNAKRCATCESNLPEARSALAPFVRSSDGVMRRCCRACLENYAPRLSEILDDDVFAASAEGRGRSDVKAGLVAAGEYALRVDEAPVVVEEVRLEDPNGTRLPRAARDELQHLNFDRIDWQDAG